MATQVGHYKKMPQQTYKQCCLLRHFIYIWHKYVNLLVNIRQILLWPSLVNLTFESRSECQQWEY